MTSSKGPVITGEFVIPIIDQDIKNSDPWERNYFQPPPFDKNVVLKSYRLTDVRPLLSDPDYTPNSLLKSHGFGVVKHCSVALKGLSMDAELAEQTIIDKYHPEIQELVMNVTGAKTVFITATGFRRGSRKSEQYTVPKELKRMAPSSSCDPDKNSNLPPPLQDRQKGVNEDGKDTGHSNRYTVGRSLVTQAKPIRRPHLDFTPLGARQTIRFQAIDIYNTAIERGVIAAEDSICEKHSVTASTREADPAIIQLYNSGGELGPRYAAYSIWRPTRRVQRDPISLSPRNTDSAKAQAAAVYWPYDNKIPGKAGLNGDYLKEYAAFGVEKEKETDASKPMEWYYVSRQEPDEVVFIKLFDSASLGQHAQHAPAPWHASPEIGDAEGDEPRESLDIRVLAFW